MTLIQAALATALLVGGQSATATPLLSNGSDGAFHPTSSLTLNLPADGVFNFTTIDIPIGVTVRFGQNAAGTPVYLLASEAVSIAGVIDVSAGRVNLADLSNPALGYIRPATTAAGGPGGGIGGASGHGDSACVGTACRDAEAGTGLSPGQPGPTPLTHSPKVYGIAGGSGSMATAGLPAWRYGTGVPVSAPVAYPAPLAGGSGGGGGSGWQYFGVQLSGGAGGGGGGALHVSTPEAISVAGSLLSLGANGGWGFANIGGYGGPGGGGSGGNIELIGGTGVSLLPTALVDVTGGYGGGLSTQTYDFDPRAFESGARGGTGYLYVAGPQLTLGGTLNASVVAVPEPGSTALMAAGLGVLLLRLRRRRA